MKWLAIALFSVLGGVVQAAMPTASDRRFADEDVFRVAGATDPEISADGTKIAYVRHQADIMDDRDHRSLWLLDLRTGSERQISHDSTEARSPRFSPDGTRVAFIESSLADHRSKIALAWLDNGTVTHLTNTINGPDNIAWSPDGKLIAYTMHVPDKPVELGAKPSKPDGAKWADPLEIYDQVEYRKDDEGFVNPGYSHLFLIAADGGSPRQLTYGDFNDSGPLAWIPDGSRIFFSANREADWQRAGKETEIHALDLRSGTVTPITNRKGPDHHPVASPDGRHVAYLGFDDHDRSYENTQLWISDLDGTHVRSLTASLDRNIEAARWLNPSSLLVSYDDLGIRKIARVGLDGRIAPVVDGLAGGSELDRPYTDGSFALSGQTQAVVYTAGSPARPADVWISVGGRRRRLTHLNDVWAHDKIFAPVTKLAVRAPDGREIDAWLVTPPSYRPGSRLPLILEIHGSPNGAYGPSFATDCQLYASHGYAVLYVNPRGSTSYGAEFANLIDRTFPGKDYDDLMAAVDAAIASGVADPGNLFVTGGSAGGALTAWIVGKTHRFNAATAQKPVINWTSEALTMDMTTFTSRYWFDKMPWDDPGTYWSRSPLSVVGNVTTPTMVVVGADDYRTPASESEQFYAALQLRKIPTVLVKVPGASHEGLAIRPSQSVARVLAIIAWFDRYRTAPQGTAGASMPSGGRTKMERPASANQVSGSIDLHAHDDP